MSSCRQEVSSPDAEPSAKRQKSSPDAEPSAKRQKRKVEDDLICPITTVLPIEPVTAEDGFVYEASAMKKYFAGEPGAQIQSPMTKKMISKRVFPAPQTKNTIETLIESGVITGDLAIKWKEARRQQKEELMQDLLNQAKDGNAKAMFQVAKAYESGYKRKLAFKWYKRAHEAGNVEGTYKVGVMLLHGYGVGMNVQKGLMYLNQAVGLGLDVAAYSMGYVLKDGLYGFDKDMGEAARLFRLASKNDCPHKVLEQATRDSIRKHELAYVEGCRLVGAQ